jgi:hypothetical protein
MCCKPNGGWCSVQLVEHAALQPKRHRPLSEWPVRLESGQHRLSLVEENLRHPNKLESFFPR